MLMNTHSDGGRLRKYLLNMDHPMFSLSQRRTFWGRGLRISRIDSNSLMISRSCRITEKRSISSFICEDVRRHAMLMDCLTDSQWPWWTFDGKKRNIAMRSFSFEGKKYNKLTKCFAPVFLFCLFHWSMNGERFISHSMSLIPIYIPSWTEEFELQSMFHHPFPF